MTKIDDTNDIVIFIKCKSSSSLPFIVVSPFSKNSFLKAAASDSNSLAGLLSVIIGILGKIFSPAQNKIRRFHLKSHQRWCLTEGML